MRVSLQTMKGAALLNTKVQPIWDSVQIGQSSSGTTNLFTVPQGQASKTLVDTNLQMASSIPKPDQFYLRGFMCQLLPRSPAAAAFALTDLTDHSLLLDQTFFTFKVGSNARVIAQGHLQLFPCGLGQDGYVTTGGATSSNVAHVIGNGTRDMRNRFGLGADYAEVLDANEQFSAELHWPAGTVTISNSVTCRVYLPGLWSQSVG